MIKATVNKKNTQEIEMFLDQVINGKIDDAGFELDIQEIEPGQFHVLRDNKSFNVEVVGYNEDEKTYSVSVNGNTYKIELEDQYDRLLKSMGLEDLAAAKQKDLKAPMPGKVLEIIAEAGQEVEKDTPLLILEAMKMENVIKAPAEGKIKSINVEEGKTVEKNVILIEFE